MILTRLNSASRNTELDAHCIRLPTPSYKAHQLVPVVVLLWQNFCLGLAFLGGILGGIVSP